MTRNRPFVRIAWALSTLWLTMLATPCQELTAEHVKGLIPEASAMPIRVWNEAASRGESIGIDDLSTVPLSAMLLFPSADNDHGGEVDFVLRPKSNRSTVHSSWQPVAGRPDLRTMCSERNIDRIQVKNDGDRATGSFRFHNDVMEGRVEFEARRDGTWRLTQFRFPHAKWITRLREDGTWTLLRRPVVHERFNLRVLLNGEVRVRGLTRFLPRILERVPGKDAKRHEKSRAALTLRGVDHEAILTGEHLARFMGDPPSETPRSLDVSAHTPFPRVLEAMALAAGTHLDHPREESSRIERTFDLVHWERDRHRPARRFQHRLARNLNSVQAKRAWILRLDVIEPGVSESTGTWVDPVQFLEGIHTFVPKEFGNRLSTRTTQGALTGTLPPIGILRKADETGQWDPFGRTYRKRWKDGTRCRARLIRYRLNERVSSPKGEWQTHTRAMTYSLEELRWILSEVGHAHAKDPEGKPTLLLDTGAQIVVVWAVAREGRIRGHKAFPLVTKPQHAPYALAEHTFTDETASDLARRLRRHPEDVPAYWDSMGWNLLYRDVLDVLEILDDRALTADQVKRGNTGRTPPSDWTEDPQLHLRDLFADCLFLPTTHRTPPAEWLDRERTILDDNPARHLKRDG